MNVAITRTALAAGLALGSLFVSRPAAAQTYTVAPLGTPAGTTWSKPNAINSRNEIAGEAKGPSGIRPFIFLPAAAYGCPQGFTLLPRPSGAATDINGAGQVVGGGPSPLGQAFLWENGNTIELTTHSGPDGISAASLGWRLDDATAINEQGRVTCYGSPGPQQPHRGVVWERDTFGNVKVTPLPGPADCLNDANHVLTLAVNPLNGLMEPCLYDATSSLPLAFLPSVFDRGWALNNADEGVNQNGYLFLPTAKYGRPAGVSWLGSFGGSTYSRAILDSGMVVGYSSNKQGRYAAFRWLNGQMQDLNAVSNVGRDWVLQRATGANAAGRIIGYGTYKREYAAFVLIPQ